MRLTPTTTTTFIVPGFAIENVSTITATYAISVSGLPDDWTADVSEPILTVNPSSTRSGISVRVNIPPRTRPGTQDLTVTATKLADTTPAASANIFIRLNLIIPIGSPTATPELAAGCPEQDDPGDDFNSARLARVNLEEAYGICTNGDEDWFKFAAINNKVYTIDISQMDSGLDLVLELYDDEEVLQTSNDDFPLRDATPTPSDTRPRIQSWRAPKTGFFYVRVRDTLGVGGANLSYRFVIRGESYGTTPTTIAEVCNDPYEQNGLPEIAGLVTSNEIQRAHRLCPEGDADWIRFFALAGRTYLISTDTRPYSDPPNDPTNPEPGADTILLLTNRDGATVIDRNNDIPGANTLDSEIEFRPSVDGFYFAQVKNVGDIGNMFIKYDLTVRACPGDACAQRRSAPVPPPAAPPAAPSPQPAAGQATSPTEFVLRLAKVQPPMPTPTATRRPGTLP